jgi:hypothetical protein
MGKRDSARSVRNDGVGGESRSWWAAGQGDGGIVGALLRVRKGTDGKLLACRHLSPLGLLRIHVRP